MKTRKADAMMKWCVVFAAVLALALLPGFATTDDARERRKAFIAAAARGDLAAIKKLLEEGADVNGADDSQRRALPCAAAKGHLKVVRQLLEKGAVLSATDQDGLTPLMNACEEGRFETVEFLLEKGADVNAQTRYGSTALRKAIENQHPQIVKLLLHRAANVNRRLKDGSFILMSAAMTGNTEVVEELLQKGADVNARDRNGSSALTWAAAADRADVVKLLKSRGAQSDLWIAALTGDTQELQRFIDAGADVNARDGQGWTPLMNAAQKGHVEAVKLLLDKGANPAAERCGRSAAVEAVVSGGSPEIVALLVDRGLGVVPNSGTQQWPLLASACKWGRVEAVKLLLAKGAEVNQRGPGGTSPLMVACSEGQTEAAKVLLDNGADVNQRDAEGRTALISATLRGELEAVKLLLGNGADVHAVDKQGRSALRLVGEAPLRELLKAHGAREDEPARGPDGQPFATPSRRWSNEDPEFLGGCIAPAAPSKTIRLDLMEVTIQLKKVTYSVDAVYHLFNTGQPATVMVAVPKEVRGNTEFDTLRGNVYETSSAPWPVRDFPRFDAWVNGRKTEFEEVCDLSSETRARIFGRHPRRFSHWGERVPTRWMTEKVTFAGKTVTTIRVRYAGFMQRNLVGGLPLDPSCYYLWGTGRSWKGRIGKATFVINSTDFGRQPGAEFTSILPCPRCLTKTIATLQIREFEPSIRILLGLNMGWQALCECDRDKRR
ncbi:MAG: ankyrin repeat domain-containing protein [Thermodesulfobacteriota bacterium]